MQELRLVAVSEDGTYLVLATAGRGTRFTLPVDDRLRAAVRGHFSRLGQFEIEVESPLRPKEIQARIRSGETAEEIAESAGIPVERVRWFEGPVLQEREYMAQQAQRVAVRRPGESTPGPPLGETVEERLGRGGVDLEEVEWDSWKCEDNTWRVRLSFFEGGRPHAAEWTFDPRRRHVSPLDEVAARLTSVEWDDDALSDTVTPLVPRRPAMKVVSSDRDTAPYDRGIAPGGREFTARGLPAEPEQPGAPEPLRAAEPRAYIVERGRMVDPRPAFREASETPSLREATQPGRPAHGREASRPGPPAEDAGQAAPSAETPADEAVTPAQSEEPRAAGAGTAEPAEAPASAEGHDESADALAHETAEPGETAETVAESTADEAAAEAARPAEDVQQREDEAAASEETEALDAEGPGEAREKEHASAEPAETDLPEQAPEARDDHEADEAHKADDTPEADEAPEAAASAAPAEPVEAAPEPPAPAGPAGAPQAPPAARPRVEADAPRAPEEEREAAPVRKPAPPREPAAESKPAAPQRQPARPPAKKKPAGRPAMPAAQDKPATGSPAAAAAAGESPAAQRPARRRKAKGKRASVPSWDEIMFGARRPE
ncbi:septation protein SepH [Actinomadura sp. NPDC000600]|uniref:septation protein SepH n=1 Tax=Actinomadura sp. NPDC000600 TaxID=3154262 RepID=UPI0033944CC0